MTWPTRHPRVFIDTSELFPFTIMDVLLTMAEDFLFTWKWTDHLLEEWAGVIVREGLRTPESAASVVAAVHAHFSRDRIAPAAYVEHVTADLSPDPDDRLHAAAAIHGGVDVLLTRNIRHLSTAPVLAAGVRVITSDEFLCDLLSLRRRDVVAAFVRTAHNRNNPPTTPHELAARMDAAGTPLFAGRIQRFL